MSDYTPISCNLHDQLEAITTLRRSAHITYQNDTGEIIATDSKIIDIYAEKGADYCKLADGTIIRLDKLQAITTGGETVL